MDPVAQPSAEPSLDALDDVYAPVAGPMTQVEDLLGTALGCGRTPIDGLLRHLTQPGGKRLRPALVLLCAGASGRQQPCHLTLAVIVEMIHLAALVHDDVLDEADLRHHQPTIRTRWGNETAVLAGDYIFTRAFGLVNRLNNPLASRLVAEATEVICRGELWQSLGRGDLHVSEDDYMGMISAKTAELFRLSCRLGAEFAQTQRRHVEDLDAYGRALGIAFQLTDDLLDITGSEPRMGKTLGTDLRRQRPTLPLLRLAQRASAAELHDIQARLRCSGTADIRWLHDRLDREGCLAYTRERAACYATKAACHLEALPETQARHALRRLAQFTVERGV